MNNLLQNIDFLHDSIPLFTLRNSAAQIFRSNGIPTKKSENWKYTSLLSLERNDYIVDQETCNHQHCSEHNNILPFEAYEIIFCNGKLCHTSHNLPKGLIICPLIDAFEEYNIKKKINSHIEIEKHPFCALNTAYLEHGIYIEVSNNIDIDKPIAIINKVHSQNKNLLMNIHNIMFFGGSSKAKLIEYYYYEGEQKSEYLLNIVNEINLSKNACLEHIKVQKDAFYANHIAYNSVILKENAYYNGYCLQKGANIGRNETRAELIEPFAKFVLNGAYIMNGWALIDTNTDVRHLSCDTYSSQNIRGVVGQKAHGVFLGKIHIAPNADRTEGKQLHKAILLSDEAEVDYKPELEIFADDVKCSHGATCGELDKEMLFYMRSRGIEENIAKQILISAYLTDTLKEINNLELKQWVQNEL